MYTEFFPMIAFHEPVSNRILPAKFLMVIFISFTGPCFYRVTWCRLLDVMKARALYTRSELSDRGGRCAVRQTCASTRLAPENPC